MGQKIAEERVERLFQLAEKRMKEDRRDLADRYVELARSIGMKYNVSIPEKRRKQFCSNCGSFLQPGRTSVVRINSKKRTVNYRCKECGEVERHGY